MFYYLFVQFIEKYTVDVCVYFISHFGGHTPFGMKLTWNDSLDPTQHEFQHQLVHSRRNPFP